MEASEQTDAVVSLSMLVRLVDLVAARSKLDWLACREPAPDGGARPSLLGAPLAAAVVVVVAVDGVDDAAEHDEEADENEDEEGRRRPLAGPLEPLATGLPLAVAAFDFGANILVPFSPQCSRLTLRALFDVRSRNLIYLCKLGILLSFSLSSGHFFCSFCGQACVDFCC